MIKNFSDHSANERTFLAWVRTSIAVMAFGFLVEKFDLFLQMAAPSLAGRALSVPGQRFGDVAGLALIYWANRSPVTTQNPAEIGTTGDQHDVIGERGNVDNTPGGSDPAGRPDSTQDEIERRGGTTPGR